MKGDQWGRKGLKGGPSIIGEGLDWNLDKECVSVFIRVAGKIDILKLMFKTGFWVQNHRSNLCSYVVITQRLFYSKKKWNYPLKACFLNKKNIFYVKTKIKCDENRYSLHVLQKYRFHFHRIGKKSS